MDVGAIYANGMNAGPQRKESLGKDDFLKLLVTQLTQQDPLNPQDGTQFVAQLAQFTSLERLTNMEKGLDNVALASAATNSTMAVSFIGKTVQVAGDAITLDETGSQAMNYTLPKDAAKVSIDVKDASGNVVRTLSGGTESGMNTATWDGLDNEGKPAPHGEYTYTVSATDDQGEPITATQQHPAKVLAVSFKNGFPELVLDNGKTVSLGQVVEVAQDNAPAADKE